MEHGRENASPEGLRYRKKLKARLAVERAALELVIERGYDGVTVTALPENPTVCLVEFAFTVAHGLNQIWLTASITI